MKHPKCYDSRKCFAQTEEGHKCKLLKETYSDGKCPFCKPEMEVTNGKKYDYVEK